MFYPFKRICNPASVKGNLQFPNFHVGILNNK